METLDERRGGAAVGRRAAGDRGWRRIALIVADLGSWVLGFLIIVTMHQRSIFGDSFWFLAFAVVGQLVVGTALGVYRRRFEPFSFEEAGAVAVSVLLVGGVVIAAGQIADLGAIYGRMVALSVWAAISLMFLHRYVRRARAQSVARAAGSHREPVLVFGAGAGGIRAIFAMESVSSSPYRPVALIDDDPRKRNLRLRGLRVEGTSADLSRVAERHGARAVLLAIPSATGDVLHRLHDLNRRAGLETLVMPPVQNLVGSGSPREITRYRDEDVLNRHIVDIDRQQVRGIVAGCRVLVTGAGGSIGSELARQLAALDPAELVLLDRDDSLLHHVTASIPPDLRDRCVPVLADIRDLDRLTEVFATQRPQVVFHAAALKHVPALEAAPLEAWKTNVLGTANVLSVSETANVQRFVNISTDKAADPVNVLGASKRIAERLTASTGHRCRRPYVSVRFGNVIGSRGSAIETFDRQIASGGPLTITHPEVTRYFMAVREAVLLTMQAAAIGRPGEALVLDMGDPVRVIDVARQLIDRAPTKVDIEIIGLRPGEKLHETLLGAGEAATRPFHPMIDHVPVPPLDMVKAIDATTRHGVPINTVDGLRYMAAYQPANDSTTLDRLGHLARGRLIHEG